MPRLLFFVLLAFLVWLGVRWLGGLRKPDPRDAAGSARAGPRPKPEIEAMYPCAWCGAHVPAGEALALPDGRKYCSAAHREAARDREAKREPERRA